MQIDILTGCRYEDTIVLTIKQKLQAKIKANIGCFREIATFETDTFPNDAYWIVDGGKIVSNQNSKIIFVAWNKAGLNSVKLHYNTNGCSGTAIYSATLDSPGVAKIIGADSIFENTTHTYYIDNPKNDKLQWRATGGTIISEAGNKIIVNWGNHTSEAQIMVYKENISGCESDTSKLPIFIKNSQNLDLSSTFHIYPNPFSTKIKIASINDFDGEIEIGIYDMAGREIAVKSTYMHNGKNALEWDISQLQLMPGLYNFRFSTTEGSSIHRLLKL